MYDAKNHQIYSIVYNFIIILSQYRNYSIELIPYQVSKFVIPPIPILVIDLH